MKTTFLLVDNDQNSLNATREFIERNPDYQVIGTALDGKTAVELALSLCPDILIIDLILPVLDGLSVLDELKGKDIKIIAVSALGGDAYAQSALKNGASYFMLKPFELPQLMRKINTVLHSHSPKPYTPINTDRKITDIFMTVGIPAHIKGYQFLRDAIKLAIDSPDIINSITKRLYPEVAQHFSTSPSKVERAIRHAIEVAWNKGKIENINSLFGVRIYSGNEKPTNGEFIALVADKMLLESV